ncbi:MAG: hypothetical protein MUE69_28410 [Myxococcota bacterium]|nr:hypothetical protein [Myxococcota bacterium]
MRWRSWMVLATMVVGCARSAAPGGTTPVAQEERERIAALEQETRRRAEEVRELESQLALARARAAAPRTETVRIGDSATPEPREDGFVFFEDEGTSWDEPPAEVLDGGEEEAQEEASGPRPVLRLHEEPAFDMPEGLPALEPAPLPSSGTLPARVAAGGWRTLDPLATEHVATEHSVAERSPAEPCATRRSFDRGLRSRARPPA